MIPSRIATLTSHRTRIAFIGASKAFQTCGPKSAKRSLTALSAKHRALDRAKRDNLCGTPNTLSGYQTRAMNVTTGQQGTSIQATALVYSGYGRPVDVLKVLEHILPPPADDSVQVQFLAAPINPADINQIEG
ncbi:mitochondrial 2-enoyl thioester reductase, partial [Podila minutissima]